MPKTNNSKHEQGKCPNCGSLLLTYGALTMHENQVFYPVTCDECGHEDKEWYKLTFVAFND